MFYYEGHLKTHMVAHMKIKKSCPFCAKELLSSSLSTHIKDIHTSAIKVKCDQCETILKNQRLLIRHMKYKHGDDVNRFRCKECEIEVKSKFTLAKHIRTVHTQERM